jgi:hypothetical protein
MGRQRRHVTPRKNRSKKPRPTLNHAAAASGNGEAGGTGLAPSKQLKPTAGAGDIDLKQPLPTCGSRFASEETRSMTEIPGTAEDGVQAAPDPAAPRRRIRVKLTSRLALLLSVGLPMSALTAGGLIGTLLMGVR